MNVAFNIDKKTGELIIGDGAFKVGPRLTEEELRHSAFGQDAQLVQSGGLFRYYRLQLSLDQNTRAGVVIAFDGGRIAEVRLGFSKPHETWHTSSVEGRHQKTQVYQEALRARLGEQPYEYAWGAVAAVWDFKETVASIRIVYKHSTARETLR